MNRTLQGAGAGLVEAKVMVGMQRVEEELVVQAVVTSAGEEGEERVVGTGARVVVEVVKEVVGVGEGEGGVAGEAEITGQASLCMW
jgi:hypothetical protein